MNKLAVVSSYRRMGAACGQSWKSWCLQYGKSFFFRSILKSCRKHSWLQANVYLGTYVCVCVFLLYVFCVCVCTWRQIGKWFLTQRSWLDRDYFNPTVVMIISIDYSWTWRFTDLAQSHIHSLYFTLSLFFPQQHWKYVKAGITGPRLASLHYQGQNMVANMSSAF